MSKDGELFEAETKLTKLNEPPPQPNLGIYHSQWAPVPKNTWVEVAHEVFPALYS